MMLTLLIMTALAAIIFMLFPAFLNLVIVPFIAYYVVAYFVFAIMSYRKKGKFGAAIWDGMKDPIVKPYQWTIGRMFKKKK